jgi:hypothetical protein
MCAGVGNAPGTVAVGAVEPLACDSVARQERARLTARITTVACSCES